ncbi:MAG: site-2 protease family protein [Candidatus Pacearchaeota archaeon]
MYLYRTRVGMKIIDKIGGKYKKTLKFLSYIAITSGYILMIAMIYLLGQLVYVYIRNPEIVRAIKIPPLMPLIPYLPEVFKIDFLPPFYFTYWIIAIAIIAIFHEFAHGILMKRYGIGIKSTGFGFLGPFLAAFVEQDQKSFEKAGKFEQIAVLSAGTFTNLILSIIFFLLLSVFFIAAYQPAGAMFNTYTAEQVSLSAITMIGGISISNTSNQAIIDKITTNQLSVDLTLTDGESVDLTKISANGKNYYIPVGNLREQLETNNDYVILYNDFPAINAGLKGTIISIDENEIKTYADLANVMENYNVGNIVDIKTKYNGEILGYNLTLKEDPSKQGRAVMGIGVLNQQTKIIGKISEFFNFFKEPATDYEPRINSNLIIFIYNLIWWLALVNISVALANMLPMGLFDGGRMFMLTMWGISGSEKFGKIMYKIATYAIIALFALLMIVWFIAII